MGPWAQINGPWAQGPWAHGPWAHGPMVSWAHGRMGPLCGPQGLGPIIPLLLLIIPRCGWPYYPPVWLALLTSGVAGKRFINLCSHPPTTHCFHGAWLASVRLNPHFSLDGTGSFFGPWAPGPLFLGPGPFIWAPGPGPYYSPIIPYYSPVWLA